MSVEDRPNQEPGEAPQLPADLREVLDTLKSRMDFKFTPAMDFQKAWAGLDGQERQVLLGRRLDPQTGKPMLTMSRLTSEEQKMEAVRLIEIRGWRKLHRILELQDPEMKNDILLNAIGRYFARLYFPRELPKLTVQRIFNSLNPEQQLLFEDYFLKFHSSYKALAGHRNMTVNKIQSAIHNLMIKFNTSEQ